MQARHAHQVQRWASLCVQFVPVRDSEGVATASVVKGTGWVAKKLEAEASRRALQAAITTNNGNPLVDGRGAVKLMRGSIGRG
jgi:hypothetical protein